VLRFHDVHKTYRMGEAEVRALRGVNLELAPALFAVIMGPSGSGKSTLLHLAGCLDVPTAGTVEYDGVDLTTLPSRARADFRGSKVGFVFQRYNLVSNLTAEENVALPLMLRHVSSTEARERASRALEIVGLKARSEHRPMKLSGGEQQRVAIARSLVTDPSMILADEPTGNLDTVTGERILELLRTLREQKKTVLVVTHNPEIAVTADELVQLRDGTIQRDIPQGVER
jgi:putative ABC transport system ATP-binding protein